MKHNHHDHHQMMIADFKKRFIISTIISLPLIIVAPFVQFTGDRFVWLLLATIIFVYGGKPFLQNGLQELRNRRPGMMTLVGLAITISYCYSFAVVFGLQGMLFFWELATLIDIMLLGHWLEMRSVAYASRALEKLASLLPSRVHAVTDTGIQDISITDITQKMLIIVLPGEKVPADGIVIEGQSEINQAFITGESTPVFVSDGAMVLAGSINGNGALTIRIERAHHKTYIAQIIQLVQKVMASKSQMQDLADTAAFWLTIIALIAGITTFLAWLYFNTFSFALERMVTVMVIVCPHALGLAIPLVTMQLTTVAAQHGLLIRNRTAFEHARMLDLIVFDKTGTLTKGILAITDIISLSQETEQNILIQAASIEAYGQHAIAQALLRECKNKNLALLPVSQSQTVPGKGASGTIQGKILFLGNESYMQDQGFSLSSRAQTIVEQLRNEGKISVFMADDTNILAIIAAADTIRDEAYETCNTLRDMNISLAIITGDHKNTASAIAQKLQIQQVLAEVLPDQKSHEIEKLRKEGHIVAMVGDGINDAPALAAADVGIAIGAGTDIALETADIILIRSNLLQVLDVIELSRLTRKKMVQNLLWATGYNIIVLPIAAGALYRYGIVISPAIGALMMSLSTIIVALNARFLTYKKLS